MGEPLLFEDAQKLQKGDEIYLSVDLGTDWTQARRLSVRSISVVRGIDEKSKKNWAGLLTHLRRPDIEPHEGVFAYLNKKTLDDFPTDVILIAADDLSRPMGKFRKGEDTITYAGVGYFPHIFYSRPPGN